MPEASTPVFQRARRACPRAEASGANCSRHGLRTALHVRKGHVTPIGAVESGEVVEAVTDVEPIDHPGAAEKSQYLRSQCADMICGTPVTCNNQQ